jgi:hypothetical protein
VDQFVLTKKEILNGGLRMKSVSLRAMPQGAAAKQSQTERLLFLFIAQQIATALRASQ